MIRKATLLLTAALCATVLNAQAKDSVPMHEEDTVREILDLERQSKEAAIHRDVGFVERTLADDYVAITPLGEVVSKAASIDARKRAQLHYDAIDTSEMVVRVYGDMAVVTARAEVKGTDVGEDFSGPYRFTRVWVKRHERWQIVSYQATVSR